MNIFLIGMSLFVSTLLYLGFRKIFINRYRKNSLAVKIALDRVIKRNRFFISKIDIFKDKVIALDRKNQKIILLEHKNNVTWEKCFSLRELAFCNITNEIDLNKCTPKVALELHFGSHNDKLCFAFYDELKDNIQELPSRIKKAIYWKRTIKDQLIHVKTVNNFEYVL